MTVTLTKADLINLVKSTKPPMYICAGFTEIDLMEFTGNQHNENWDWRITELNKLNGEDLWRLYQVYK